MHFNPNLNNNYNYLNFNVEDPKEIDGIDLFTTPNLSITDNGTNFLESAEKIQKITYNYLPILNLINILMNEISEINEKSSQTDTSANLDSDEKTSQIDVDAFLNKDALANYYRPEPKPHCAKPVTLRPKNTPTPRKIVPALVKAEPVPSTNTIPSPSAPVYLIPAYIASQFGYIAVTQATPLPVSTTSQTTPSPIPSSISSSSLKQTVTPIAKKRGRPKSTTAKITTSLIPIRPKAGIQKGTHS